MFAGGIALGLILAGHAAGSEPSAPAPEPAAPALITAVEGEGDPVLFAPRRGSFAYTSGDCVVDTPLPDGYPRPTAPGVVEIKRYPVVRRAEVVGRGSRDDGMRGRGSTQAFWPLFRHIQQRDIAMTSPVEMDYREEGWSMSFLYRQTDQGPKGQAENVLVYDAPAMTVITIGVRGDVDAGELDGLITRLRSWVDASPEWVLAGDPRKLSYNGPDVGSSRRWHEVQLPIALKTQP